MSRTVPILFVLLASLAAGCGPIRSTVGLVRAEQAVQRATEAGADEVAPYPMTLARELIQKAHEEQGYASYDTSMHLANEAETLAREALFEIPKEPAVAAEPLPPLEPEADAVPEVEPDAEPAAEGEAAPDVEPDSEAEDEAADPAPEVEAPSEEADEDEAP